MSGLKCGAFEGSLIELARQNPLVKAEREFLSAHLESCEACRAELQRQRRLSAAASVLAAQFAQFSTPLRVEAALRAELKVVHGFQRRRFVYGVLGGAIAASLALVWWFPGHPKFAGHPEPIREVGPLVPKAPAAVNVIPSQPIAPTVQVVFKPLRKTKPRPKPEQPPEQPFFAIPYAMPLQPYDRAEVVRMDLPVAALIAAGIPTSMMDPGARARTDVLVGQDGQARAIRLVSFSTSN